MSLNGLLNQTITLSNASSYDGFGREVVGASTLVQSRFQKTTKQKLLPNGSLITIEAIAYVPANTTVAVDAKVSYADIDYKVYGIYNAVDGTGHLNHLKLELVKWIAT
jgi:hypothetical protein